MDKEIKDLKDKIVKAYDEEDFDQSLKLLELLETNDKISRHDMWFVGIMKIKNLRQTDKIDIAAQVCDEVLFYPLTKIEKIKIIWMKAICFNEINNIDKSIESYNEAIYLCTQLTEDNLNYDEIEQINLNEYIADMLFNKGEILSDTYYIKQAKEIYNKLSNKEKVVKCNNTILEIYNKHKI